MHTIQLSVEGKQRNTESETDIEKVHDLRLVGNLRALGDGLWGKGWGGQTRQPESGRWIGRHQSKRMEEARRPMEEAD